MLVTLVLVTAGLFEARPDCPLPVFTPSRTTPQPGDVFLKAARSTCTTLEIDVVAHALPGLFTLSFDVTYPAALLRYEAHEPGPLLRKGTTRTAPFFLVQDRPPGRIEATMTRFAPDGAVAAVGSEAIVTLRFSRLAAGSGVVDFALGAESAVQEKIVGAQGENVSARFGPGNGGTLTIP